MNAPMIFALAIIALVITLYIWLMVLVSQMAKSRGRSTGQWIVFAIFLSPILAWVALVCLGETPEYHRWRIAEEERIRIRVRQAEERAAEPQSEIGEDKIEKSSFTEPRNSSYGNRHSGLYRSRRK